MPIFTLATNLQSSQIPDNFSKTTSSLVAKLLSKPESYVAVMIDANRALIFGGTNEPAAIVVLKSIGGVGDERNKSHSKQLCAHIKQHLGIATNRIYIEFVDIEPTNIGYDGSTF